MKYWNKAQASITVLTPIIALVVIALMVVPATAVTAQAPVTVPREQCFQVVGFFSTRKTLNPISPDFDTGYETATVYEALAYPDPIGGGLKPWLAESWSWIDDHTLEIHIRPEAYFRKGQPVTADDVKFSLDTLGSATSGVITGTYAYVQSVEVVNETTVRIHSKADVAARSPLVEQIMIPPTRVLNKAQWSALIAQYGTNILQYANNIPDDMNGSGPYTLLSDGAATLIWVRVDNWWGNAIGWYCSPKYYTYVYCGSYDAAIRVGIDEKLGDVIHDLGGRDLTFLVNHRYDLSLWNPAGPTSEWQQYEPNDFGCVMNITKPIFQENWFRYVVAYALDYHKMFDVIASCQVGVVSPLAWLSIPNVNIGFPEYIQIAENITAQYFETENDHATGGFVHIAYDPAKAISILQQHCTGSVATGWTVSDNGPLKGQKIGPLETMGFLEVPPITNMGVVITTDMNAIGIPTTTVTPPFGERWTDIMTWTHYDLGWMMTYACPPNPVEVGLSNAFVYPRSSPFGGSQCEYQTYWDGTHSPLENTAATVKALVDQLWVTPEGTQASYDLVRQIYAIVIPQLPMIPVYQNMSPVMSTTFNWANWSHKDDPLDYATYNVMGSWFCAVRHVMPKLVDTTSVALSSSTVHAGVPATITVALKNNGTEEQLYPVYVNNGPAAPGEYLSEPDKLVTHTAVEVPAGGTATATLNVTFNTPGTYTLTVDDWRYSASDPGDPVELTLTVTAPVTTTTTTTTTTVPPTTTTTTTTTVPPTHTTTTTTVPPTTTTTTTTTVPPTTTTTTTTTAPPSDVWTWVAVGIGVLVVIAIVAWALMRKK